MEINNNLECLDMIQPIKKLRGRPPKLDKIIKVKGPNGRPKKIPVILTDEEKLLKLYQLRNSWKLAKRKALERYKKINPKNTEINEQKLSKDLIKILTLKAMHS